MAKSAWGKRELHISLSETEAVLAAYLAVVGVRYETGQVPEEAAIELGVSRRPEAWPYRRIWRTREAGAG